MAACRRGVVVMVFLLWAGLHTHVHACECVGPWLREEEAGLLASPCYPQQYPNSQSCRWRLQAPPGFVVQLTFVDFQLEEAPGCVYDRVAVHGGGGRVDLCGLTAHGLTLNSSGNVMDVEFTSDFSVQKKGFRANFRHVAVALRNLKVSVAGGNGQFATVSSSVAMPTLHHLTLCFDLERSAHQQVEWIFTYKGEDGNTTLALGGNQSGVKLVVGGVTCLLDSIMTPADWSLSMKNLCLLWSSSNGRVGIFLEGNHRVKTCSASTGISVAGGGTFRLGGVHSFEGNVYNMRLWDYAMTVQQLSALTCHVAGNIIDWDNTFWDIPSTLTQKDHSLSCSVSSPSNTTLNTLCDSIRLGCPASGVAAASSGPVGRQKRLARVFAAGTHKPGTTPPLHETPPNRAPAQATNPQPHRSTSFLPPARQAPPPQRPMRLGFISTPLVWQGRKRPLRRPTPITKPTLTNSSHSADGSSPRQPSDDLFRSRGSPSNIKTKNVALLGTEASGSGEPTLMGRAPTAYVRRHLSSPPSTLSRSFLSPPNFSTSSVDDGVWPSHPSTQNHLVTKLKAGLVLGHVTSSSADFSAMPVVMATEGLRGDSTASLVPPVATFTLPFLSILPRSFASSSTPTLRPAVTQPPLRHPKASTHAEVQNADKHTLPLLSELALPTTSKRTMIGSPGALAGSAGGADPSPTWSMPVDTARPLSANMSAVHGPVGASPCNHGCDSTMEKVVFYRLSLVVRDESSTLTLADVEEVVSSWLNQTFQNWTHLVFVDSVSVQSLLVPGGHSSFTCRALLLHNDITDQSPGPDVLSARISSRHALIGAGLVVHNASIQVTAVDTCPEDNTVHYRWPETRPSITRLLPCFPNKERSAARKCLMDRHNFSSFWSPTDFHNCTDIDAIQVSAENAAEVAAQLAAIANNQLSKEEVSKVVSKVKQLVHVAKINTTLASAVITVISNVMSSPHSALAPTSDRALKAVDQLLDKLEFEGSSVSITSRRLSLGVLAFNASTFNGTSFSAFIPPNATDPEIDFESERTDPLAQVTLPPSLLTGASFGEARINFLFFRSTNLFQSEQDGRALNSYVVASSVGNWSVSDLSDPVQIEMVHLSPQAFLNPVCVFWDFSMNGGAGGWNADGCTVSKEASGANRTVCLCDHLTHFGILMDISGVSPHIDRRNNRILTFISFVGCGVSAIFSAATLLTYIAFEKLRRDYPSKILMNLSASLLLLNMAFLLNGWLSGQRSEGLCLAAAVLLHYFLLTSFTWMGLESVHMYIALVKVFNTYVRRYILKFCLLGWGIPAVLVGTVVAVNKRSYGPQEYGGGEFGDGSSEFCWIQSPLVFYTACVAYFCLVFLLNVAMFVVVMLQICGRNGKRSNRTLREEVVRNLRSVVSLTFLLGMTWSFALFAWGPVSLIFVYLFAIFNSLQGLFIFLFHCALKENVQKQWRRSLCCARFRLSDNSDWSKTATNNTKKVTSEQAVQSLSSGSFGSSAANWTSKAKVTLKPFTRNNNTESCWSQ
ncbi:adhesion G-protein coupled receptor G6 isoform X2 [Nerophis lumbriciformis]|uniref:adhesion G-protein coupled receptor G6 isoform X2 n=1 Tax=Nerophis lumbriciformis TaxID=546530 RepID=UPI002AE022B6|nr:adhesion G-protein coupled receptor G6 isoform X2 [Nerophis lumbriciformis]